MPTMLPDDVGAKVESFWKKPEGKFGAVVAALLGAAGLVGLYKILPFIITLLQNTLYTVGLLAALGAILYVLFDPKFRAVIFYLYRIVMRRITGFIVELDPINIMRGYVDYLKESLERMDQQLSNLNGQIEQLRTIINRNAAKAVNALKLAKKAGENSNQTVLALQSRQAGRLQKSNLTYQDLLSRMEVLYRVLRKMREVADTLVQDTENEVEQKVEERKIVLASYSAFKSAMKIINGDQDKKAIFDQAMEFTVRDCANKVGEIEHFLEMSSSFIQSVDLQNGVFEEDAMKMLQEWEKKGDSILLGSDKQTLIAEANDPDNELSLDAAPKPRTAKKPQTLESGGKYLDGLK